MSLFVLNVQKKMNKDFPCKVCTHVAYQHYANVVGDSFICTGCYNGARKAWNDNDHLHKFVGDNFKYLELLNKREELKSE
jgi:hypothetical protein